MVCLIQTAELKKKQEDNIDKSILPGEIKSIKNYPLYKETANATEVSKISICIQSEAV